MTIVTGKHKEILIELLIYYLTNNRFFTGANKDIREQNTKGKEWIEYYINNAYNYLALGNGEHQLEPQNNNPEHTDEENNDSNG
jgi:hypothetical protein